MLFKVMNFDNDNETNDNFTKQCQSKKHMVAFAVFNHVILLPILYHRPQTVIGSDSRSVYFKEEKNFSIYEMREYCHSFSDFA